jgi:hypothetical protein
MKDGNQYGFEKPHIRNGLFSTTTYKDRETDL